MSERKAQLLGMPIGTASNRLRKLVIFDMMVKLSRDECFQCGDYINSVDDLSVEHKVPWQSASDPFASFFDIGNIAFSHLTCNFRAASRPNKVYASIAEQRTANDARRRADPDRVERINTRRRDSYSRGDNPNRRSVYLS